MNLVLRCDRCDKLMRANHIATLCVACSRHTHDWAHPLPPKTLESAGLQAFRRRWEEL
jgi:hypothetical protein